MKTCMTSQGHALFDESGICHFHLKLWLVVCDLWLREDLI